MPAIARGQWISKLPVDARSSILWKAEHESDGLRAWTPNEPNGGGGIFNTGGPQATASLTTRRAHSGKRSVVAKIEQAIQGKHGARAVRLMRWTDAPWQKNGKEFPQAAYFSTWMLLPHKYNSNKYSPWDPGDGGWWNVFQFKSHNKGEESQPTWSLQVYFDDASDSMYFGLYSSFDRYSIESPQPLALPVDRWFHVEALYVCSAQKTGQLKIWQDGNQILEAKNVQTIFQATDPHPVWGIGNYTDHIATSNTIGSSEIYFDDCIVSTSRISKHLTIARKEP